MDEICQAHSKAILDHFLLFQEASKNDWPCVMIPIGHVSISNEWFTQYIKKRYLCYGYYWYFECEKDAAYFILRWK